MDHMEASNIVYSRIRKLESEDVAIKVLGCLFLQDDNKQEMIRLAFGPDRSIQNLIERAKVQLGSVLKPNILPPISPSTVLSPVPDIPFAALPPASSPVMLMPPNPFWDHQINAAAHQQMRSLNVVPTVGYVDSLPEGFSLRNPPQLVGFQDQFKLVNPRIHSLSPIVSGSRQIYLTFLADTTFSEDDVADYFSIYGPVEDVRFPRHQRRMFGFVTFACSTTVKLILSKGNPHFVCGACVLVKPYREKPKILDRKLEPPRLYNSRYA